MNGVEPCGDCGFDHELDPEYAANWHNGHPGSYSLQVIRGDCFRIAESWPAGCVDLIVTDPPYGAVLKDDWDQEWSGSGSTAVAARKLGRRCVLIEKSQCPMHEGLVTG